MPATILEPKRLQIQPTGGRRGIDRWVTYFAGEPDAAQQRLLSRRLAFKVADPIAAGRHFAELHALAKEAVASGTVARFLGMLDKREEAPSEKGRRFEQFAQDWLDTCVVGSDLKPSQVESDQSILNHHLLPAFGKRTLAEIDARAVDQFKAQKLKEKHVKGKGYAPATVNNMLSVLHRMMEKAIEWKEVESNPVTGRWVRGGTKATERAWWTPEEQQRVVAFLQQHWLATHPDRYWPIMVQLLGGLRYGELKALRREDIDPSVPGVWIRRAWARNKLSTPKNRRQRPCILPRALVDGLKTWSEGIGREHLFAGKLGRPVCHHAITRWYNALAEAAKVPRITSHGARHSAGTGYDSLGAGQRTIALLLGHENLASTARYVHANVSMATPVVEERWKLLVSTPGGPPAT